MEKNTQTLWTIVIAIAIIALAAIVVIKYFLWILLAGAAFLIGYYLGYERGKQKR